MRNKGLTFMHICAELKSSMKMNEKEKYLDALKKAKNNKGQTTLACKSGIKLTCVIGFLCRYCLDIYL